MSDANPALARWLELLQHPNPAAREEAILELELLGSPVALPALAEVFAMDPEPALRGLAQQTGKAIYYGTIRQALEEEREAEPAVSEEERRRAAEILAKAKQSKNRHRRR
ncbi:MAG: hypothetical protein GYB65_15050 [Chloroflexi bacterium]|nr:hypothetical protein [Chloroflexota bacterium]